MVTERKVLEYGIGSSLCRTNGSIEISYCSGGCGTSFMAPLLVLDAIDTSISFNKQCKCCSGTTERFQILDIVCVDPVGPTKAYIPVIKAGSCKCDACLSTGNI